jgi:hypothetical protein
MHRRESEDDEVRGFEGARDVDLVEMHAPEVSCSEV